MDEHFVMVEGYPNYIVSSYGRVLNQKHDRELVAVTDHRTGWQKVKLYRNGVPVTKYIHRLVAQAFFVNYDEDREVNFIDSDHPEDCSVTNLTIGLKYRKN